jgi:peptide/nickel transport system permease protein
MVKREASGSPSSVAGIRAEPGVRGPFADFTVRLVKEKPLGLVGAIIVIVMFLTGILASFVAPYGMNEVDTADRLKPPSELHILGTDQLGRDVLSRIIYGARVSMIVGLGAATLATLIAVVIGTLSGFFSGTFDTIVQRLVDAWMCFPWLFIVLTVMVLLKAGVWQVIVVLGITYGISNSRVVRSAVIGVKENVYIEAAAAVGAPARRILIRHILPNVMAPIIIIFTVGMGGMILAEATISFLGYGIPPPTPSWGGMLSWEGRRYMLQAPWLAFWPGLALSVAVYGINMLGDAVRDILDPRLRGGVGRYAGAKVRRQRQ